MYVQCTGVVKIKNTLKYVSLPFPSAQKERGAKRAIEKDDAEAVAARLRAWIADPEIDVVITTGGTGMTPDDITPEATRVVIHREAPGLAEAMRAESVKHTPLGILTRGIAGIAESTLIVNFPGNPKAVEQLFPVIAPVLSHAVQTLRGDSSHGNGRHGH